MNVNYFKDAEILITGGTGSLGKTITKLLLSKYKPKGIRILSRGEALQWEFKNELNKLGYNKNIDFLIGDIRDSKRVKMAMKGVNIVIHTAAIKQVPVAESNPFEVILTNIHGSQNIIEAALSCGVEKVMNISTDKAAAPLNLYGMTKAVAEKVFTQANVYSGGRNPRFSSCRYGNVLGSRGSVVLLFKKQKEEGQITITDARMTRYWIKIEDVAQFVLDRICCMHGAEIFIPKMPSSTILEMAKAIAPELCDNYKVIGVRKGEKLHEVLITVEEGKYTIAKKGYYIIKPIGDFRRSEGFSYTSNQSLWKVNAEQLREMIK